MLIAEGEGVHVHLDMWICGLDGDLDGCGCRTSMSNSFHTVKGLGLKEMARHSCSRSSGLYKAFCFGAIAAEPPKQSPKTFSRACRAFLHPNL